MPIHQQHQQQPKLFEGLRTGDLKGMVSHRFSIDQYKSKMGNDETVIVVSFNVKDKFPAIDLMEFIEKGYPFVLDADMSTGEEKDGDYSVFVELERNKEVGEEMSALLRGIGQLCDCTEWKFRYFKDTISHDFTKEKFVEVVPTDKESYQARISTQKVTDVSAVLDQGPAEVADIDESDNMTFRKPFTSDLTVKLEAFGDYRELEQLLEGGLQLDSVSNGQTLFLEKYLGNYVIHKIDDKFLIKNGNNAVIISKNGW